MKRKAAIKLVKILVIIILYIPCLVFSPLWGWKKDWRLQNLYDEIEGWENKENWAQFVYWQLQYLLNKKREDRTFIKNSRLNKFK